MWGRSHDFEDWNKRAVLMVSNLELEHEDCY